MKNCGVVLKQTCYDRCKDKVVGRCTQKECCKFCNGKKQNCFLFGQKTCKAVISKVCNMSRTEKIIVEEKDVVLLVKIMVLKLLYHVFGLVKNNVLKVSIINVE